MFVDFVYEFHIPVDTCMCSDYGGCEPTDVTNFVVPPGKWLDFHYFLSRQVLYNVRERRSHFFRLSFRNLKFRCHQVSICNFGRLLTTTAVSIYGRNSHWLWI
jgi:hypothetical protein